MTIRDTLKRLWTHLRSPAPQRGRTTNAEVEGAESRLAGDRVRFWAELREGRREAAVRAARLRS